MKKLIYLFICFIPFSVQALSVPEIDSEVAIVYDINDDKIILDKNSHEQHSIASLTKIMTVLTALENIDDLNETVTVTKPMLDGIYWNASVAGLVSGDTVTYLDLLYAAILPSGADATQILAYSISGDVDTFVALMNDMAKKIGAKDTIYVNTTGLDEENATSTAYDQALILKYALENPVFKEIYSTKNYTLTNGLQIESTINKYNRLLNLDTSKIIGSKTGNTSDAGLCMSALFQHEFHDMLVITLGASIKDDTFYNLLDTLTLIDYVNNEYEIPTEEVVKVESIESVNYEINIPYEIFIAVTVVCVLIVYLLLRKRRVKK